MANNAQQTAPACTYSFFGKVEHTKPSGQINWHNLIAEVKSPPKHYTEKLNIECLAAHSYMGKTKQVIEQGGFLNLSLIHI